MLRKLLKYDLRANLKIYLFVWPAMLLLALINRLCFTLDMNGQFANVFVVTTTTVFLMGLVAACVLSLIISIIRFYGGLLRSEGYLMFTLPVKTWQLILSKLLSAFLSIAVTVALSYFCLFFVYSGIDGMREAIAFVIQKADLPTGITLLLSALICLVGVVLSILQIYLACSIGHMFRRRRILFSILFYYAIGSTVEFVSLLLSVGFFGSAAINELIWRGGENLLLGIVLAAMTALCFGYFFLSERLLRKHLNLE